MTRTILLILLLSGPAIAGVADWKSYEQGDVVAGKMRPGSPTGNGTAVVEVGAGSSVVESNGATGAGAPNQAGTDTGRCISWITLEFSGSEEATGHRWKIVGEMKGSGSAGAGGHAFHSSWADSIQALDISGDLDLVGLACLGVEDSASATFSLSLPPGLRLTLGNQTRSNQVDEFVLKEAKASTGAGKICRVRLDSFAKTSMEVKATIGSARVSLHGLVTTDIEMTGSCRLPSGTVVTDTFRLGRCLTDRRVNEIDKPNGGHEKRDGIPTDEPTEDEEAGSDDPPPVDAEDLEKIHPEAETEDPYAEPEPADDPGTADADGTDDGASGTVTTPGGNGATEGG